MTKVNFKTQRGLKIRLDHRYLFYRSLNSDRQYTEEEIIENDRMQIAVSTVERLFQLPTSLIQIFTIIALLSDMTFSVYCITMLALYLFGCLFRNIKQNHLISTILLLFPTAYSALWWLVYPVLAVLVFVCDKTDMILPYLLIRVSLFIISLIIDLAMRWFTNKKYGVPFGDTELCAFVVFHALSGSDESVSDFISDYVCAVQEDSDTE